MHYDLRKVLLFFLILVLPAFIFKEYRVLKAARESYAYQPVIVENKQAIDHVFVVTIIVEDTDDVSHQALASVMSQTYEKHKIILVDNGANHHAIDHFMSKGRHRRASDKKIDIVRYNERLSHTAIIKKIADDCDDDTIIALLKPSDWLANNSVLETINQTYSDPEVWLTFSAYLEYPSYRKMMRKNSHGITHVSKSLSSQWRSAGLKTFYSRLIKEIDVDTFKNEDEFFKTLSQISKWHMRYIPQVHYVHNRLNIQKMSNHLQLGLRLDKLTQGLQSTTDLAKANIDGNLERNHVDLVIFSQNQPFQLAVSLESIYRYAFGLDQIKVIYSSDNAHATAYKDLQKRFTSVVFIEKAEDLKPFLLNMLEQQSEDNNYVVFATDGLIINNPIYFQDCANALYQTKAFAFFLDKPMLNFQSRGKNFEDSCIHIIEIEQSQIASPFEMVVYLKSDVVKEIHSMEFETFQHLSKLWSQKSHEKRLGLYYEASKIIKIH